MSFRNESNEILISCWLKAKTINMANSYYSSGILYGIYPELNDFWLHNQHYYVIHFI